MSPLSTEWTRKTLWIRICSRRKWVRNKGQTINSSVVLRACLHAWWRVKIRGPFALDVKPSLYDPPIYLLCSRLLLIRIELKYRRWRVKLRRSATSGVRSCLSSPKILLESRFLQINLGDRDAAQVESISSVSPPLWQRAYSNCKA